MRIVHTHHLALLTPNFTQCRDFYVNLLGMPICGAFPGRNIIFVDAGSTAIEIIENSQTTAAPSSIPWNHLALEVDDIDAAYEELSAQGVMFHVSPKNFPEDAPSVRIAFFKDPDGNVLELVQSLGARYPQTS